MKVAHLFIKTNKISKENRKQNIHNIINFAIKKLNLKLNIGGFHPSEIANNIKINEIINGGIISAPKHNPDKLEELVKINDNKNFLPAEDLSNFISHMNFWKKIVENKIPYSIVIEDDVVIDYDKLNEKLKNHDNIPKKFWFLSLLNEKKIKNRNSYNDDYNYITMENPQISKIYIITYECAKLFLSNLFPIKYTLENSIKKFLILPAKGFVTKQTYAIVDDFIDIKIPIQPIKKIPDIGAFYLITIERSKEKRSENINNVKTFVKETYDKELHISGVDGSLLTQDDVTHLVLEDIIEPTKHPYTDMSLKDVGKLVRMSEFKFRKPYMNSSEIGVFLSHYNIWKEILDKQIPYTIIFEDDAKLETKNFAKELEKIMNNAPENFDIISLYKHEDQLTRKFINYNDIFYLTDAKVWGATAYLITLNAVKDLLENIIPIKYPVDYAFFKYFSSKKTGYLIKERIIKPYDDISVICHKLKSTNAN